MSKSQSKSTIVTNINSKEENLVCSIKETVKHFNTTSTKVRNDILKKSIMFYLYLVDYNKNTSYTYK